jgi:hypothetical protein
MALLDSRGIASQRGPSSSFRRKTATADAVTQIAAIWAGNEKLGTEAVIEANLHGLAVMFSPTSDGGALGVHAWYGTRHWKDYCTTAEQLEDVLEGLRDFNPAQPAPSPLKAQKR